MRTQEFYHLYIVSLSDMKQRELSIAKINRPKLARVYERERLFRLLDQGREKPVTWISGPAGSGKTTLAASWLDARKLPCLWYQLDEGDGDIATFFYYLGLAGQKAAPRAPTPLPLLAPEYLPDIVTFARRFFEDLCARVKPPFFLVFDNYQAAGDAPALHGVMQAGLSRLPEGVRAIVVSREDPPQAFASFRANNGMELLGWDALRLTPAEAKEIARREGGSGYSAQALSRLHAESDGWAAGLVLLLKRAAAGGTEVSAPVPHSHRDIFDYFAAELFDRTPQELQDFLLATALPPKVSVPVAEKLTGNEDAGALLSRLARSNYFTELHVGPVPTYQYHPLFREFLLARAGKTFSPERLGLLRRRAGDALEQDGRAEEAAELYLAAGDLGRFAVLLLRRAADMIAQGRHRTLEQWLAHLPAAVKEKNPWFAYWEGMCRLPVDPRKAREWFEKAYAAFRSGTDDRGLCLSWCGVIYSIYFEFGDFSRMDAWVPELERTIERRLPDDGGILARVADCAMAAFVYRQPSHPGGPRWTQRAERMLERLPDDDQKVYLIRRLLHQALWQGDVPRSLRYADELTNLCRHRCLSPLARVVAQLWVIYAHSLAPAHERPALRFVPEVLATVNDKGMKAFASFSYIMGVYAAMVVNDLAMAGAFLADIQRHLSPERYLDMSNYYYKFAEFKFLNGAVAEAYESIQQSITAAIKSGVPYALAVSNIGASHIAFEMGRHREADGHLAKARVIARKMKSSSLEYNCLLLGAGYALARNQLRSGLRQLEKALHLGKEKRFMNAEWWIPPVMSSLCATALEHGIEPAYASELIARRNLSPPSDHKTPGSAFGESWPWPVKIYTLGRFELALGDKPARFSRKAPRKPLEVLKALIASGRKELSAETLTGILWQDADGHLADQSLATTLKRLRQLIGSRDALQLQEGRISLDPRSCWVDAWAFEKILDEAETGGRGHGDTATRRQGAAAGVGPRSEELRLLEKAIDLYKGTFLPDDTEQPWAVSHRERLRGKYIRALEQVGRHQEQAGELNKAAACYEKGIEVDDLAEEFYRRLMILYERTGRRAEAVAVYLRCKKALAAYGVGPSPETEAVHEALRKKT